jgi:hypothetical protein
MDKNPYVNVAYQQMLIDRALREEQQRKQNRLMPGDWRRDVRVANEQANPPALDPRFGK